jgi:hypothetical protein
MKIADKIGESLLRELAREPPALFCRTSARLVRIVGHESLKAMGGRFSPFTQFLAVGCMETLPPPQIEFRPQNDRYDSYPEGFGRAQQDVQNLRYLMIGVAALGCEPLKNWVMMGAVIKGPEFGSSRSPTKWTRKRLRSTMMLFPGS